MHCECGLEYVPGVDNYVHAKRRAEYEHGPTIEVLSKIEHADSIGQYALIVVDRLNPSPLADRSLATGRTCGLRYATSPCSEPYPHPKR